MAVTLTVELNLDVAKMILYTKYLNQRSFRLKLSSEQTDKHTTDRLLYQDHKVVGNKMQWRAVSLRHLRFLLLIYGRPT